MEQYTTVEVNGIEFPIYKKETKIISFFTETEDGFMELSGTLMESISEDLESQRGINAELELRQILEQEFVTELERHMKNE